MQSVLADLPGVDVNDPALQAAIQAASGAKPAETKPADTDAKKDDDDGMDD